MLAGICGGIAEYFNIDPVIVRIIAVIILLAFNLMAVIAYIILIFIIPLEDQPA
jgi:phage shock protein C